MLKLPGRLFAVEEGSERRTTGRGSAGGAASARRPADGFVRGGSGPRPDADRSIPLDAAILPPELNDDPAGIAPLSGGAPGPFLPSEADWRDDHERSAELDRRREAGEGRTDRHSPEALARINRVLYGREEPIPA
jgi:hypothetical protein